MIARTVAAAAFLLVLVMALVPLAAGAPKAKKAKKAISAPVSVNVKSASLTSITLAWSAPMTTTRLRGYDVYRNGSRIRTSFRSTTTSSLSYTVSGLTCGRSYSLGVAAVSILGVRSPVSSLIASTSPCPDSQPPSAPTAITQVAATTTSATVTWARSTDNFGVTGYAIYRDGVPTGQTAVTSYTLTGLLCGATYATAVDAFDAAGNRSSQSRYVVSTSACVDTDPPSQPGALSKAGGSATSLSLSWGASSDNVGVAGYGVWKNGTLVGSAAGTSFEATGLSCGTSYSMAVDAYDRVGNRSAKRSAALSTSACPGGSSSSDTQPPSVPQGQRITGTTQTSITMAWNASTDNVGVSGYEIWLDNVKVTTTAALTYTYTGVACGTNHTLGLVAFDAAGNRSDRAYASGSASTAACPSPAPAPAPAPDGQAPTTPGAPSVTVSTQTSLTVAWSAATDNVGVSGYRVYRGATQVGTTAATSHTVTGLACGTSYTLAVDAYDAAGNHSAQAGVTTSTSACPDTQPPAQPANVTQTNKTETSLSIRWDASSDNTGVVGYRLFKAGAQVATVTGTTYTFTGLACNTSYTLGVNAYDASANASSAANVMLTTSPCMDTQAPSVPQGQQITGTTQTSITMAWNASSDNVGVAGYEVWLDDAKVTTTTGLSYTYGGLTCGTTHTVGLVAYDAAGNRSDRALASGPASTTPCPAPAPAPTPPAPDPTPPAPDPTPPPPAPGAVVANLWVDVNGGSCVRQSTASAWIDAQACSWNNAYQAAQTGDLILVKGGSYGNVDIGPNKASISSPGVTFRTASGESVVLGDLENGHVGNGGGGGSNISFIGPVTARTFRSDGNSNITVDNWTIDCGGCDGIQTFHLEDSSNVTVKNSDISDNKNNSLMWINGTNLTFENNRIHDAGLPAGSGAHTECMYVWDVTNLTLKRNHFYHCAVMDVFITGGAVANGGFVENNVFEKPWGSTGNISNSALAFQFRNGGNPSPDPNNWDFRYNTFVGPLNISGENPVGAGGMRVIGNVFLAGDPCGQANTTYSHNAFVSGACGTNSITNSLATYLAGFASTGDPGTYSLLSTSVLRDKGSLSSYPAVDKTGNSRFAGVGPDMGAYEVAGP